MNGSDVRQLRITLGLTPQHLAELLGVHLTTVYRWEKTERVELRLEPLQHRLLMEMQQQIQRRQPKEFGQQLIEGLLLGGTLLGLACLLSDLVETKPRRRSRS